MDKVIRELRVDLTPAEIEARRQSLAENGLQLVAWEANRKEVLAPIDTEGKHLKTTRKELAQAIETRKELRSVECVWVEEGTQRYLRRVDNGEVVDQEPLSPEEIRKARQTALPLEETPPEAPSSPALALPEHAGPGLQEEAQAHEGGPIAPEAPYAAPALPAARHQDAVDGEIVVEAEPSEANVQRAVVRALEGRGGAVATRDLVGAVTASFAPGPIPSTRSICDCLDALELSRKVRSKTDTGRPGDEPTTLWSLVPEAPKASKGKKGKGKPSKPSKQEPPVTPLAPPAPPASGHPQRVLRSWIYARVGQTVSLSEEALASEAKGFHREYIAGTISLLLACDCLMEWNRGGTGGPSAGVAAIELPGEKTVDEAVLDVVAHILLDAPLSVKVLAEAMDTPTSIVQDVLEELRDQKRVAKRGEAWTLVGGKAAE